MKNRRILIAIVSSILFVSLFCLIFVPSESPHTEEPTIDISTEKHNGEWPSFGLSATLPIPSHYDGCGIITDTDKLFWARVDGLPFDDFSSYIEGCKQAGYTENNYSVGDYLYYGESDDGQCVQLTFNTYTGDLVVQVAADAKDPDKWRG